MPSVKVRGNIILLGGINFLIHGYLWRKYYFYAELFTDKIHTVYDDLLMPI